MNGGILALLGLVVVMTFVARRVFGHRPRMWTLKDGTYMTGCGCGWAGEPRRSREEAEADMAAHKAGAA